MGNGIDVKLRLACREAGTPAVGEAALKIGGSFRAGAQRSIDLQGGSGRVRAAIGTEERKQDTFREAMVDLRENTVADAMEARRHRD